MTPTGDSTSGTF